MSLHTRSISHPLDAPIEDMSEGFAMSASPSDASVLPDVPLHLADWRFILQAFAPGPYEHLVLIGGPNRLPEILLQLGLAQSVSRTLPMTKTADVIVVLGGARPSLSHLASSLKDGGILYHEINRLGIGSLTATPPRFARALGRRGFSLRATYVIAPHPSAAMVYLPLSVPRALDWYVNTLYDAPTGLRYGAELVYRLLRSKAHGLLSVAYPWLALIATAGSIPARKIKSTPDLPELLNDSVTIPLLLTDRGNRVVMLPFSESGTQPEKVLKIPKVSAVNDRTENEQRVLGQLRSDVSLELQRSIPRPMGTVSVRGVSIAIEDYRPGVSMKRLSSSWTRRPAEKIDDLKAACEWIGTFHRESEIATVRWGPDDIARWAETPISEFRRLLGETPAERMLFDAAIGYASSLKGLQFPLVWHHRDFNIWNVFRNGTQLSVLDWEGGRTGPPMCDVIHFSTHWFETVTRSISERERLRAFRALWFTIPSSRSPYAGAVHESVVQYASAVGIDMRFFSLLLLYTWIELTLRRAYQQRDQGIHLAHARDGNRNFAYVGELASHADLLFDSAFRSPAERLTI